MQASEFALGEAVFYQNGTWAYNDIKDIEVADEDHWNASNLYWRQKEKKIRACAPVLRTTGV